MQLGVQRKLAASVLHCSPKRVWLDETRLSDIKEAITKQDVRGLIAKGLIQMIRARGISRGRARFRQDQRRKGRQRSHGSRKGLSSARHSPKLAWIARIRLQRRFIQELREKNMITNNIYRELYMKSKGGFFRSLRHVKLYLDERKLIIKKK